ncbi:hypothetical protein CQW23_25719 [Capsicum baccatum]|uniref:F-box/kelch-repeat protein n=1 Tax=Capsicum baccatum TaxID=33114 RepID=A0A2G2VLS6_CAPBA|nr:hypothetical protein CQW23_25719 [Capsicum baccatum]
MIQSVSRSAPSTFFGSITNKKALKADMLLSPYLVLIPEVSVPSESVPLVELPPIPLSVASGIIGDWYGASCVWKGCVAHVIYRYSLLTNMWSTRMLMNAPSCLFGKASLGELAIFSGGCDSQGKILSSAELNNSETGTWRTLRSMNKQRKMCSGVFIIGKFFVIGVIGGADSKLLTCAEYDLARATWSEISNMSPVRPNLRNDVPATSAASPVVAVVSNQLYTADYAEMSVRKYEKHNKA